MASYMNCKYIVLYKKPEVYPDVTRYETTFSMFTDSDEAAGFAAAMQGVVLKVVEWELKAKEQKGVL